MEDKKYDGYHTFEGMMSELKDMREKYPAITRLENFGTSVQGREMLALKISDTPLEADKDPAVLFVSLVHGLEVIGLEVLLALVKKLLAEYGKDPYITNLVKTREIWFLPAINPDGFANASRKNSRGVDLNRNFPVGFKKGKWSKWFFYSGENPLCEPETRALADFVKKHKFIISCSFHSFLQIINYPYGFTRKPAEDEDLFRKIGRNMSEKQSILSYRAAPTSWFPFFTPYGNFEDWIYEKYETLSFCFELSKGGLSFFRANTWFDRFSWFNPTEIFPCIENNIPAALYLLERANDLKKQ